MAISLKNVDDRLKALESKGSSGYLKADKLWSGTARNTTLNIPALVNYGVCYFRTLWGNTIACKGGHAIISDDADNGAIDTITITWTDTNIKTTTKNAWHNIALLEVYGLKIYYIFRYNILKLILSTIKFITHKISSRKGGEDNMSYSMKNHEDRILKLEQNGGSVKITKLYEGASKSLSLDLREFDIVFIHCGANAGSGQTCYGVTFFPKSQSSLQAGVLTVSSYHATITFTPTSQYVTHRGGSDVVRIRNVYGLTIYYIVRYNIYNKILSEIKFQAMSEIFTKIFKNGGEDTEMAISLKNIDDRLKKLESGSSLGYTAEKIAYTGPSNLNGNAGLNYIQTIPKGLSSYDFILFKTYRTPGGQQNRQDGLCPVAVLKSGVTFALTCQPGYAATASMINETQIRVVNYNFTDVYGISKVILYYFSNIIKSKILHSNISTINNLLVKFVSSFSKIFSKGGIEFGY